MKTDDTVERLMYELTITRLALAQSICNSANDSENRISKDVARHWRHVIAPDMTKEERKAGIRALCQYFDIDLFHKAQSIWHVGWAYEPEYWPSQHSLFCHYPNREYTNASDLKLAIESTCQEFFPGESVQDRIARCDKRGKYGIKGILRSWKAKLCGVRK